MESQGSCLDPADALGLAASARAKAATRLATPRWWDAAVAMSIGVYFAALAYGNGAWVAVTIPGWVLVFVWLQDGRRRRAGLSREGSHRATWDAAPLAVWGVLVVLFVVGMLLRAWWAGAPTLSAAAAIVVAYGGFRWANRRAIRAALGERS